MNSVKIGAASPPPVSPLAERARLVVADIDADDEVGRIADEPGVACSRWSCRSCRRPACRRLDRRAGAALDDALQHRRHLVGGHRIEHLVAVVDDRRLVLVRSIPSASQPSQMRSSCLKIVWPKRSWMRSISVGLTCCGRRWRAPHRPATMRITVVSPEPSAIGKQRRQVVVDAEAARIFGDERHAHVLGEAHGHHVARLLDAGAQRRGAVELAGCSSPAARSAGPGPGSISIGASMTTDDGV